MAPEVLEGEGYGPEIDWWSVGIILFEMLAGYPPFCSDEPEETCKKVLEWEDHLVIPEDKPISNDASDLIFKLLSNVDIRLGRNGAQEIKDHPFFKGIDWENIRKTKGPFIPDVSVLSVLYFVNN